MLKPFGPADFDAYLDLSRAFYASEATDHPVPETHFRRTFDEIVTSSPLARGWTITADDDDDRPDGYLLASLTWSNEFGGRVAWLEELYLRPEVRGRGVGRQALEEALEELRETVAGFRLEVAPANVAVSELYRGMGFTPVPYHGWWMAAR